jgi:hypothetical protein
MIDPPLDLKKASFPRTAPNCGLEKKRIRLPNKYLKKKTNL